MELELGQNFRFGYYYLSPEVRMKAIRDAGFTSTMLWWGEEYSKTDGTKEYLYGLAEKNGLAVHTVHFPSTFAHHLWLDDEKGDTYVESLVSAIHDCGKYRIKNLVLHLTRKLITVPPNQVGLEHLQKACSIAEKEGVKIAIENTRFLEYNRYIFENISSKSLGFCFDSGHANCYTPTQDPLEMFGKYLVTTHIHDNYGVSGHPNGLIAPSGEKDLHNLIGDGNIDFSEIFRKLKKYKASVYNLESYCFEHSKYYGKTADEFLRLSFEKLTSYVSAN